MFFRVLGLAILRPPPTKFELSGNNCWVFATVGPIRARAKTSADRLFQRSGSADQPQTNQLIDQTKFRQNSHSFGNPADAVAKIEYF